MVVRLLQRRLWRQLLSAAPVILTIAACLPAQFAIYPLELVHTRLAVCPMGTYRGISDCFRRIVREEGYRAFYRGLSPSLVRSLPHPFYLSTKYLCLSLLRGCKEEALKSTGGNQILC